MQTKHECDVFISYSSRDKAWVRGELLKRIEKAGLKAFIDFRDFTRGAPSIKEMERGVLKCQKTLLILTPNYLKSEWCEFESLMAARLTTANRKRRLIPIIKTPCKKPLRIGALTHIDFTDGADLDLAWRQLLTALGKPPEPEPPKAPQRDDWLLAHPYPMPPNFTGRVAERAMLTRWLEADAAHPLLSLRALGGFGKSALAWHWLTHDVAPAAWPRVVWWSFYEGDASFDHFLAETLDYLSGGKIKPDKLSAKDAVKALLQMLHPPGTLLVLDGFERVLRAFGGLDAAYQGDEAKSEGTDRDCLSPRAENFLRGLATLPNVRSKVLITTRLCPHVLEARGGGFLQGCREEELKQMQPADAVEFFRVQGIRGTHTEIEQACAAYGYHPLSLRLLAAYLAASEGRDINGCRKVALLRLELPFDSFNEHAQSQFRAELAARLGVGADSISLAAVESGSCYALLKFHDDAALAEFVNANLLNEERMVQFRKDWAVVEVNIAPQTQPRRMTVEPGLPSKGVTTPKCRILFLAANPEGTAPLMLDEECREIEMKLRAAEHRDSLEFITKWALRPEDLLQHLNQYRPHIVHFSGHGTRREEIVLLDPSRQAKTVSKVALKQLFSTLKDNIRVVVLNACFSRAQAEGISEVIDFTIGMKRAIGDRAAIVFAAAFYQAIGFRRSVPEAFNQGKVALLLEGIPEEDTPELLVRTSVDPCRVTLFDP
jgi:hypothetical protein